MNRFVWGAAFFCLLFPLRLAQASGPMTSLQKQALGVDWQHATSASIVIEAPLEDVWSYLSDSQKAKEWSVYFDHITPLPGPHQDGEVGSIRRCFRNSDETGKIWDEMTVIREPLSRRILFVFNIRNFRPLFTNSLHYFVEQRYERLSGQSTRLVFSTVLIESLDPGEALLMRLVMRRTRAIFLKNLVNIKAAIEQGKNYRRIYPWLP